MIKCLIVDDEEMAVKVIESHLAHLSEIEVVGVYHNAMDAFSALQKEQIDLLFLDIQMPKMSGLALLQSLAQRPAVILTTAHREFALDAYDLEVVDYLLKPIALDRFLKAVAKIIRLKAPQKPRPSVLERSPEKTFFYIKSERQFVKIYICEILYIESLRNHVKLLTTQGTHITMMGISEMADKLTAHAFIRIHRSFIVSIDKVQSFSQSHLQLGDRQLPIGKHYRANVLARLQQHML